MRHGRGGRLRPSPGAESSDGFALSHTSKVREALAFWAIFARTDPADVDGVGRGERAKGSMPPSGIAHRQLTPDPVRKT